MAISTPTQIYSYLYVDNVVTNWRLFVNVPRAAYISPRRSIRTVSWLVSISQRASRRPQRTIRWTSERRRRLRQQKSARARIKNPRRRYVGEQHGHHVTRLSRAFRVRPRRRRSIILRVGFIVSSRDRSMCAADGRTDGEPTQAAGPTPAKKSLSRRRLGSRRSNAVSSRAASENNFEETHLKSDLNIAYRGRGKYLERFRLLFP